MTTEILLTTDLLPSPEAIPLLDCHLPQCMISPRQGFFVSANVRRLVADYTRKVNESPTIKKLNQQTRNTAICLSDKVHRYREQARIRNLILAFQGGPCRHYFPHKCTCN